MTQATFTPASLPEIDAVEIVDLEGRSKPCRKIEGKLAQQIAELWRQLPPDRQMRCHIPAYRLRFYQQGNLIIEGSICWECNNIYASQGEDTFLYEFDATHAISQKLLDTIREIMRSN